MMKCSLKCVKSEETVVTIKNINLVLYVMSQMVCGLNTRAELEQIFSFLSH